LPDNSILITANMQSETGFLSSHQLKSYVASKSRLRLAARAVLSADAGLLVPLQLNARNEIVAADAAADSNSNSSADDISDHRSRIRYLSKKKFANFNEFSEIKKIRKNSYKNLLNARV